MQAVLVITLYLLAWLLLDKVASIFQTSAEISLWYPPPGLSLVLLLKFGWRYTPALLLGPLLNFFWLSPSNVAPLYRIICALWIMLGYGTASAILRYQLHIRWGLRRFRDMLWLIIVALLAPVIVGAFYVTTLAIAGKILWSMWGVRVLHFWAGDATGIAMLTPPLLILLRLAFGERCDLPKEEATQRGREILLWGAEIVTLASAIWIAYGVNPAGQPLEYSYLIFLPLLWIAVRHGFEKTALVVLLLNLGVALVVGSKLGESNIFALQFCLLTASFTGLILGAIVTKQKQTEVQLRRLYKQVEDQAAGLEQRVAERTAQLQQTNAELEAFTYSVSHDLRTPLRAMAGFSRLLLERYAPQLPAQAKHYLQRIDYNTQKMGELIDALLKFSRLGRQSLRKQLVAPVELVREVLAELQNQQADRNVEVLIDKLPVCQADAALLKQVWFNLLDNALKYTRSQPTTRIEIGYQLRDHEPVYFVKDNGIGFESQYAHKLFAVFERLHSADEFEGTGVGLAIVQRIINRHGGRIWAEAAVNQGATFYFTLAGRAAND